MRFIDYFLFSSAFRKWSFWYNLCS